MDSHTSIDDDSKRLQGKVVVITGGARGIGAATARLFSRSGAHVVIADVLGEAGSELAESIGGRFARCDVSNELDVEKAVRAALDWRGRIDVMFNNAGISGPDGSITNLETDDLTSVLKVNVNGTVHGIKHASRAMILTKTRGAIICSSSSSAMMGGLASHAYTMSKAAVVALVRSTACELGQHGIRVNCVSPHGVPTEMLMSPFRKFLDKPDLKPEDVSRIVGDTGSLLKGRGGSVDDVARAVLFLASEDSSGFVTGHNLVVDGGYTSALQGMKFIYGGDEKEKDDVSVE